MKSKPAVNKGRLKLGNLGIRQRTGPREFRAVKSLDEKIADAKETQQLIDGWLAVPGNQTFLGEHGPKEKPLTYRPAHGKTRL